MQTIQKNIPARLNTALCAAIIAAVLLQLFVLPLALAQAPRVLFAVIVLLVPVSLPFWGLIHEAVHKNLFAGRAVNEKMGRLLSVVFGIPFSILRFGHLMHHQFNREWESEMYGESQRPAVAAVTHYSKMLGGLYLSEVAASYALALVPAAVSAKVLRLAFKDERHLEAANRVLLRPDNLAAVRFDCAAIAVLYGSAFLFYGAHWPLLAALLFGRAFLVSLMDNAYHYGTPPDNSVPAKELKVPAPVETFLLSLNHHLTHHNNPALAWNGLSRQHAENGGVYTETLPSAVLAQFRGPIKVS